MDIKLPLHLFVPLYGWRGNVYCAHSPSWILEHVQNKNIQNIFLDLKNQEK